MVSRRKILSRSRDDLNLDQTFTQQEEEEDVWYQKDKLYKEHIQEVLDKWTQIDDEIWAKVIVFERNRRVAKAYARAPVLTINGSDDGFDGMRIGLCGFDNPMRDQKTDELKRAIGQGIKIKMDDAGNILVRRYAKSNVFVKSTASNSNEETSIGAEILKLPNQALESEKIVKLFDMKKFQSNVNRELRRAYPDRRRLETQCLSTIAFVKSENDILECPIWVLIVNVVAMDMLKSKLPPVQRSIVDIKNRPRIPIPDEDPYSVAGNGSNGSSGSSGFSSGHQQQLHQQPQIGKHLNSNNSGHVAATREQLILQTQHLAHKRSEKPPKLPPRDNVYALDLIPKPDYDDIDLDTKIKLSRGKSDKGKDNKKYDDPYYCGLRARVPNFVKSSKSSLKDQKDGNGNNLMSINGNVNNNSMSTLSQKKTSIIHNHLAGIHPHHIQQQQQLMTTAAVHAGHHQHPNHHQHQIWQTRSYESGIGIYKQSSYQAQPPHQLQHKTHAMQMQLQQPHSLPTDLTTKTTNTEITAQAPKAQHYKHHHFNSKARNIQKQHLQSYPPVSHIHMNNRHHHQHCQRKNYQKFIKAKSSATTNYFPHTHYYDDMEEVAVRQGAKRLSMHHTQLLSENVCNCVSCYALAPLCGELPAPRPQRSLSQHQLRRHQRLSGGMLDHFRGIAKWCSESDISVLEQVQEDEQNTMNTDDRYNSLEYDDFDLDIDIADNINNSTEHSYMQHLHKTHHQREKVSLDDNRSQLRQLTAPALLTVHNKALSTESFFEQPNEEGSLYMYGGRKCLLNKAPTSVNIYEPVTSTLDSNISYKDNKLPQAYYNETYLRSSRWQSGCKQQPILLEKSYKSSCDNFSDSNSNNKRQLLNSNNKSNKNIGIAKNNNDDVFKNKNILNGKNKSTTTAATKSLTTSAPAINATATTVNTLAMTPITTTNNASPPLQVQRTGRAASRLDISDMESIYGYLKPHSEFMESPYNHIYGRHLPLPTRGYVPTPRMFIGEWD